MLLSHKKKWNETLIDPTAWIHLKHANIILNKRSQTLMCDFTWRVWNRKATDIERIIGFQGLREGGPERSCKPAQGTFGAMKWSGISDPWTYCPVMASRLYRKLLKGGVDVWCMSPISKDIKRASGFLLLSCRSEGFLLMVHWGRCPLLSSFLFYYVPQVPEHRDGKGVT